MDIEFVSIGGASYTFGSQSASLRALDSYGALTDSAVSALPAFRSVSTATYSERALGTAIVAFKISGFGADTQNNGIASLAPFSSSGYSFDDLIPQYGFAEASMYGFSSAALVNIPSSGVGVGVIKSPWGFGSDVAGDIGVAYLPKITGESNPTEVYVSAYVIALQLSTASLYASTALADVMDSAVVADSHTLDFVYGIVDRAVYADQLLSVATTVSAFSGLTARDRVQRVIEEAIEANITVSDDMVDNVAKFIAIIDTLRAADNALTWRMAVATLADSLTALSVAVSVADGDITDAATVMAALDGRRLAMAHLIDTVVAEAEGLGLAIVTVDLTDTSMADDSVLTATTMYGLIEDGVRVSISLTLDGLPYVGICMNASLKGVTEFQNYEFNSLATLKGRLYGAGADGLYLLEGPDDAGVGISALARTPLSRIAGGRKAHVDSAYLGYSAGGQMQMKVITTEATGTKTSRVYELKAQTADTNRAGRIKLGKGLQSVYWAFELSNVLGADFTIDVVELHVLALSRRI